MARRERGDRDRADGEEMNRKDAKDGPRPTLAKLGTVDGSRGLGGIWSAVCGDLIRSGRFHHALFLSALFFRHLRLRTFSITPLARPQGV